MVVFRRVMALSVVAVLQSGASRHGPGHQWTVRIPAVSGALFPLVLLF